MTLTRKVTALIRVARARRHGLAGVRMGAGVRFDVRRGKVVVRGTRVNIGDGARIAVVGSTSAPAVLELGDRVRIGDRCIINVAGSMTIGAGTEISWGVQILDTDFHTLTYADGRQSTPTRPVVIGEHVLVGTGALILKGAEIGDGAVVGAGSVVTGAVAAGSIVAGNPARVVGQVADWR
jgi:carbonic anhydrase/acetyltransferase-like protein (isoleucine patch superfamily)